MYRNLLLALHIAAVGGWIGANFVQFVLTPRLGRGTGATVAAWWDSVALLSKKYYTYLAVIILVTGILLLVRSSSPYEFSNAFVSLGFLTIIVGGALAGAQFGPIARKTSAAATEGDAGAVEAGYKRVAMLAVVDTVLVLVTILAMVAKWGY
ncbi:MAG: hypothetical protein R2705_24800 [Ilumatobacteraceae bacterium]